MVYRYTLKSTGSSSHKYGACEICKKHAAEVYHQAEEREFLPGRWTQDGCFSRFGHRECLVAKRR